MIIYYFIFNGVRNFYVSRGEKDIPGLYALGIVMLLQFLTILGLVILPSRLQYEKIHFEKWTSISIMAVVLAVNYLAVYVFSSPDKIGEQVENFSVSKRKIVLTVSLIHIIVTLGLIILLASLPVRPR